MEKIKQNLMVVGLVIMILVGLWMIGLIRNTNKQYNYIGQTNEKRASLMVTGEGKIVVKPDVAMMNFGLTTQNASLSVAQKENADKMNEFLKQVKKDFNIDDKDIQTTNYQINPRYDWQNNRQNLIGYEVSQNLQVKVRKLDNLSSLIEKAAAAQLNQVGGLQFMVDDLEKVKKEAREKAFAQAKQKAEDLAKASGVKLGKVLSVSEGSNSGMPVPMMYRADTMMKEAVGAAIAPSIESGSNEVIVNASLEYEIL